MLATVDRQPLAAPHPDPGHAVDRTAARLWYTLSVIPQSQARVCQRARSRACVKISKRNVLRAAFRKMHGFELW
jgi:hypothetical protein